jgi:hypothetical protein
MMTATATATAMCSYLISLSLNIITIITTCSGPIPGLFMLALSGNHLYKFQWCLAKCMQGTCLIANGSGSGHLNVLVLHLTCWMCINKYKYVYMHTVTDLVLEGSVHVE